MNFIKADANCSRAIYELVQKTIKEIYPKYYPKDVVHFFCRLHSEEAILRDILNGRLWMLLNDENVLVGTGSCEGNHITRVYVLPEYQGNGCGTFILKKLEENIKKCYSEACLDASFPAAVFYERRGYKTTRHINYAVESGAVLVYEIMEKQLVFL